MQGSKRHGISLWAEKSPGVGNGNLLIFMPRKFHGQRTLVGYSPWGRKESHMTQWLGTYTHTHGFNYGVVKNSYHMIHQSHFWAYMWRKCKHYLEEKSALHIHSWFIHISQDMKITYVSIDKWMDKKCKKLLVYTHGPGRHYTKWNKS